MGEVGFLQAEAGRNFVYGYMGKILRVNLTKSSLKYEPLNERVAREFLGGRGLAAWILFNELDPGIDPLGPSNKMVLATGPWEGTQLPGSSRYGIFAKSPLTGIWGESTAGGRFPVRFKASGFDAIIVEGVASSPVYLWLCEGRAELKDASHLWGLNTGETTDIIIKDVNEPKASVACIGPAGEHLVLYGNVMNDCHCAAGRTGMGAVMGSKKLKAVAAYGTMKTPIADSEGLQIVRTRFIEKIRESLKGGWLGEISKFGTDGMLLAKNYEGILPTKNFQTGVFEGAEKICGETMSRTILVRNWYCPSCPIGCKRVVKVDQGKYSPVDPKYGGIEYETAAAFGSLCLIDDLDAIARMNQLCNMYGIDTISCGAVIAFTMELYDRGILDPQELGGLRPTWGNADAAIQLIEDIAYRRGMGDILAMGVRKAALTLGKPAKAYALHVKGLELPMHEPRGKKGLGLTFATSPRGACHMQGVHDPRLEGGTFMPELGLDRPISRYDTSRRKVQYEIIAEHYFAALPNSLVACVFPFYEYPPQDLANGLKSITGWPFTFKKIMTISERIINLQRAFNVREGITRKDDRLPKRFGQPLSSGLAKDQRLAQMTIHRMLDDYYEIRGWDKKTGIPERETLKRLGLGFVAAQLESAKMAWA